MILYNVTINIDSDIEQEWLDWMRNVHIPDVLKTGMFVSSKIFKLLKEEEQGTSYAIQYFAESMDHIQAYHKKYAPLLQSEHNQRYQGKFTAFKTLLEQV